MKAGAVIWITGVPASGKTTLARGLVEILRQRDIATLWLDSDALREVMTPQPTYNEAERQIFYDTLGYLARQGAAGGVVVVLSATAMHRRYRDAVRHDVPQFAEVWLRCSAAALRRRDVKGLYGQADARVITALPGAGAAYEAPAAAEVVVDTDVHDADATLQYVVQQLDTLGITRA